MTIDLNIITVCEILVNKNLAEIKHLAIVDK